MSNYNQANQYSGYGGNPYESSNPYASDAGNPYGGSYGVSCQ